MQRCPNCKRMQPRADVGLHAWEAVTIRGAIVAVCSSCASNLFAHAGQAKARHDPEPWDPPDPVVTLKPKTSVSQSPPRADVQIRWYGHMRTARYCAEWNGPLYLVDGLTRGRWLVYLRSGAAGCLFKGKHAEHHTWLIERSVWADNAAGEEAKRWVAVCLREAITRLHNESTARDRIEYAAKCSDLLRKLDTSPTIADMLSRPE
jgi:hypothetical protein